VRIRNPQKRKKKRIKLGRSKRIGLTLGDPLGVGPEIIHKSLRHYKPNSPIIVFGETKYLQIASIPIINNLEDAREKGLFFYPIQVPAGSDPSFEYVRAAVESALDNKIDALVTAPISKEHWQKSGVRYNGHTGYLADAAGVERYAMFFWSRDLKVALFTIHVPLASVFKEIRKEAIISYLRFLDKDLFRLFKKRFSFLVSGLNPHAGEGGYLGNEEIEEIIPAINSLKKEMDIDGPYPPDMIFLKARGKENTVVISWYHDQGLIPFKLLNLHSGVNVTLGLPFVRTSPDHGTAFDIAGKDIANPSSMKEAIQLAEKLIGVS